MDRNPIISVLIINYNTSKFIKLILEALNLLTANEYQIIICDNGSKRFDRVLLRKYCSKYDNITLVFRKQSGYGSIGHAEALDLLVKMVDTPYFVTMDSDATFLMRGWDQKLIERIDETTKCIGTPIHEGAPNKQADFPLVFSVLYETNAFKQMKCSFMPENTTTKDTGWKIRKSFSENGFKGVCFKVINTRTDEVEYFSGIKCAYYLLDQKLIASHWGRGSSLGIASKYKFRHKIPVVTTLLKLMTGIYEREMWIRNCYSIIRTS